ncbi:ring-type domain-containing protein [Citrus sinensis]|uniref:RING-type domain-containing protein n=1 Tax=Citrus clementina TaxID=85681 RepID=V4SAH3_CITCL|nr:probable BOI-related E3 ubiquitin-protein ligase 3 [Citrus x clementina]XP_006486730.2 probable BOI-related E3 ubiquitin-protein ligase 3 [Citrus sinensis]ESR35830.1 hypothetical protein CICLE_v10028906mg [Citrus x clementina]KAH9655157.1 ring-type domain-containing protein [Citrus sinensis]
MAIQAAHGYSENNIGLGLGFGYGINPLLGGGGSSPQDLIVDNACCGVGVNGSNGFCFDMQPQKLRQHPQHMQQQQLQHQQQRNQNFDSMPFSQSLALQAEKQRQEIDHYIISQNERLRLVLQEQRKQQLEVLLKKIEIKTSALLRQKDEEIAKATNRTMELEILLKKLEMESQAWQRIAQENEAMVFSLNNSLEQLKEKAFCCFNNGVEDAESCCDVEEEETEQNRVIGIGFGESNNNYNYKGAAETEQEQRSTKMVMVCKGCNSRDSCVLFLPCRHLCACRACEAFLDSCPVCLTPKKASIEALIF